MENTYLSWLSSCKLEIIKDAGHYSMQEAPVNLSTIIENFMKKRI
jgi:hypothetical protein